MCGAQNCNYLCPEEGILNRHLVALHSEDTYYNCVHCNLNLSESKILDVDMIMKHLKMHDIYLYQCGYCKFMHYQKHIIERHVTEKHPTMKPSLIVLREMERVTPSENTPASEKDQLNKPWNCGMCKFKCSAIEEIKSHTVTKHNMESKYKCSLCLFKSEDKSSFQSHFKIEHSDYDVDYVVCYYKQEEETAWKSDGDLEFNTAPLWQRRRSIKYIRGIPLDEGSNSKMMKELSSKKMKVQKLKKNESESDVTGSFNDPLKTVEMENSTPITRLLLTKDLQNTHSCAKIEESPSKSSLKKFLKCGYLQNSPKVMASENMEDEIIDLSSGDEDNLQSNDTIIKNTMITEADVNNLLKENETNAEHRMPVRTYSKIRNLHNSESDINVKILQNVKIGNSNPPVPEASDDGNDVIHSSEIDTNAESNDTIDNIDNSKSQDTFNKINTEANVVTRTIKVVNIRNLLEDPNKNFPRDMEVKLGGEADVEIGKTNTVLEKVECAKLDTTDASDTIEIPDDDDIGSAQSNKIGLTLNDIRKMGKNDLLHGNYMGTYGPYGTPWKASFKCPLCEKYTCTNQKDFIQHMYKELHYKP